MNEGRADYILMFLAGIIKLFRRSEQKIDRAIIPISTPNRHGNFFASVNRRGHGKRCTIDSEVAFFGSLNIAQYHIDTGLNDNSWHDYGVKLQGENVALLDEDFTPLWSQRDENPRKGGMTSFLANASLRKRKASSDFVAGKIT